MRSLLEFVRKEFYHILRDFRTLAVMFGLPAIELVLFGYAIRTEINFVDIGIVDNSKDYITQEITNKVLSSHYFKLKGYYPSAEVIESEFKKGAVKEVIIFPADFSRKLTKEGKADIQLILDATNPNLATLVNNYTSSIIMDYQKNLNQKNLSSFLLITPEVKMLYNPELKSVNMFVPGLLALILMLISAMMTSITITREKEMGNMEILLVSPLNPVIIIIGKVIPYIILSFLISLTVLGLGLAIFGVPFKGSFVLFLLEMLVYLMTSLSLGILISTLAKTQQVAMMVSLGGLLMPTVLLSGFIFPIENMPVILQYISKVIPATWFLIIIKSVMLKGLNIEFFWKETLVLLGMSFFFFAVSMKKMKIRLE